METIVRTAGEFDASDRQALEQVIGHGLRDDQRVIIRVMESRIHESASPPAKNESVEVALPEWCQVYAGLSDGEVAELERTILSRADLSRPSE